MPLVTAQAAHRPPRSGTNRLRVVVMSILGQLPFAGVAWQVLHYLEGLRRLGHDVYYVEDTGAWPYDPEQNTITDDPRYPVAHIGRLLEGIGLGQRWAYCAPAPDRSACGPMAHDLDGLFRTADVLINVTGSTWLRDEHLAVPARIYLETDPVALQIERAQGSPNAVEVIDAHTCHFTFGENIGTSRCPLPTGPVAYRPTRQPVILDWWSAPHRVRPPVPYRLTTIASWAQSGRDVSWDGETYLWSKHHEFERFITLPSVADAEFELALANIDEASRTRLRSHGWAVVDALRVSKEAGRYRAYVFDSDGEFTVAKDQNIRFRSGWFSDRSACYLAAGKPVITQDTGFGDFLPVGRGLFAFRTVEDVLEALEELQRDYDGNSGAAREIAEQYFRAETVLAELLAQAGLG